MPKVARRGKKKTRKKPNYRAHRAANPKPPAHIRRQLTDAVSLYKKFREDNPRYVDSLRVNPAPAVMMEIGKLDGVLYTTTHGRKSQAYIHKFTGRSKPTLATDANGKRLFILGGHYNFTEDGIVDKK